jgi:glycosyltransferase involved in cell wall biosynthesis
MATYFHAVARTVNPANARALVEAIDEFQPDVAYLWNLLGLGGLGILALLEHQGTPWVWHLMDRIPRELCYFGGSRLELARELGRFFPGRYIFCSSHLMGEVLAGEIELGNHAYVVPNWVSGERPAPRTEFFSGGELRILTASGLLGEEKGTAILIETAAVLRGSGLANFRIDIYGRETDPVYRTLLHRHGVADLVHLMGSRTHDELLELYSSYDVFAFPTWTREPNAFVPLEAAAAGCLPLFTADCGNAEWLIDGVDCLKAPRTPEGFARRVAEILRGEVDIASIARRSQAVVWREFHLSHSARAVEQILIDAAAERKSARGTAAEFFALARFAEGLTHALVQEA